MHLSTKSTDFGVAKAVASHLLLQWHACTSELAQVNETKVIEGSPLLAGAGLISIQDFCEAFEVAEKLVLQEILNNNIGVACRLSAQAIYWVDNYTEVEREDTGGFVLDSAFELGIQQAFTGYVKPFHQSYTISKIIECGYSDETAFRFKANTLTAAFCDLPGIRLTTNSVFITKIQAERIRAPWVKSLADKFAPLAPTSKGLAPSISIKGSAVTEPSPEIPSILEARFCNPKFSSMPSSTLLGKFLDFKKPAWGLGQQKKMATTCGAFIDLMNDPIIGSIDRELMREYDAKLRKMPANRYDAARRHGTNNAAELLALAEKHGEQRLSPRSVEDYLSKLSEFYRWAVTEDYFNKNPADKIFQKVRGTKKRAQDDRQQFNTEDLNTIFSAEWFREGGGRRNKHLRFSDFRPYYYWLPLLGLYTGARLNELSQLYLSDIIEYDIERFYISINEDDTNETSSDEPAKGSDKSIKNGNSKRDIPLHSKLIELGLPKYIEALKASGNERLFPELRFDKVKGYGKAAGRWFNERFLGIQLSFERDGKKTFHSFRHTFITSLKNKGIPENIINEFSGHQRGETMSLNRYSKDTASRLYPYLEALDFELPPIQKFKIPDGLDSIKHALRRRTSKH